MPEAYTLSVSDAAEQVRSGQLAPTDYVGALLDRIDTHEPDLQAWVAINREAVISDARQREQESSQGIMAGVPVGLKDIFYTAGMKTTACSRIYADFVPEYDATCVARLKESGAIILGKAVTTEFATSDPSPSRNPWNREHTPGGSSSGSSVAVASGMCPAALGSQTGGSTCRPAAYNGIVGLKPTYGRISRYGVVPVSWSLDTVGILVRTVTDAAILLQTMAGYDANDPGSAAEPVPNFVEEMGRHAGPPRLGLLKTGYFFDRSTPEVRQHTEAVAAQLAQAGAVVEELELPDSFATAPDVQRIIMNVECAAFHEKFFRHRADEYGPRLRANIETGLLIPSVSYLQAQRLRREFRRDLTALAERVDALLMPATPAPAPKDLNTTGDAAFQAPWTSAGLPTVVIPSGLAESGLPLGIQFAAPPFAESQLLGAARWCERALGLDLRPPGYG
jgi:aspartyl-tRNA(Asn)/glutamyl-tRNA(Gln) amidotransferase subunit A